MKRFMLGLKWHCLPRKGLFLGLRYANQGSVMYDDGEVRKTQQLLIGLLIATIVMEFRGKVIRILRRAVTSKDE